jgi:CheY-like chemotaxis protein
MPRVLIAADAPWVREEVASVLFGEDVEIREVSSGAEVLPEVQTWDPDLVVLDFQIGNMGGMATCLELRLEESVGRLRHIPVLMLIDRRPDVFLARRAGTDGWLIKPLDPIRIRKAAYELLVGRTYFDDSFQPQPVLVDGE